MTMQSLRKAVTCGSAALIFAGLLGAASLASAADDKKAPPKPAPKAAPAKAPPKSGGTSGGAKTGGTAGGAATHGPTAHYPSAGPSANHPAITSRTPTNTAPRTTTNTAPRTSATPRPSTAGPIKGPAPVGSHTGTTANGSAVRIRPGGKVSDVHDAKRGIDVHNNLGGGRRVLVERPDHSRIVSERGRPGYVQRSYSYQGHSYASRSYYYRGQTYNRYYSGYGYHGVYLNVYAPGFYYGRGFYGWAYNPWAAPVVFGWGWGGNPWFGFYGGYFQPYPVYPSAAFWLTDYIISQDLQAAYAAHQEANEEAGAPPPAGGQPALTPEVKQMIADEVKNQLALESQEATQNAQGQAPDPASSGIARLLSDGRPHVFVAGGSLDVTDTSGHECVVSDGDTLQLRDAPPSDATTANLVVLSSKGTPECQISLTVAIQLTDLQEMQNHMRETIDQGLQDLQSKQGTGGLPAAPPSARGAPAPAAYAAAAPPPDPNVATVIQQQDQQAGQAVQEVTAEAAQEGGGQAGAAPAAPDAAPAPAAPAPTVTIELGQTTDQVQAALGAPARIANLGPKVIYYYSGMKITFKDGKVSNVQ